jgi:predicted helicase
VIEAKSQVVPNTVTESDFQEAFKKMAEALGMVHMHVRVLTNSRVTVLTTSRVTV